MMCTNGKSANGVGGEWFALVLGIIFEWVHNLLCYVLVLDLSSLTIISYQSFKLI